MALTSCGNLFLLALCTTVVCSYELDACDQNCTVTDFAHLLLIAHCKVIYGNLELVNLDFSQLPAYIGKLSLLANETANVSSFQLQVEDLRGYLLVAQVSQLSSLALLLPKLSLIRGNHLWWPPQAARHDDQVGQVLTSDRPAYSLVVYKTDLTDLGLYNLRMILNGNVFILENERLCLYTINWETLIPNYWNNDQFQLLPHVSVTRQTVFLRRNAPQFVCFTKNYCPEECNFGCWNTTLCQLTSRMDCASWRASPRGGHMCCDSECLTDCTGSSAHECRFCRHFQRNKLCVTQCAPDEVLMRDECVERKQCYAIGSFVHDKKCVSQCPPSTCANQLSRECVACSSTCSHTHIFLRSMERAAEFRGCRVLNGNVTIAFDAPVMRLLKAYLGDVETINGFLLVQNSKLESLEFFSSLRNIGGMSGENVGWSFRILNNDNLKMIWDPASRAPLQVHKGHVEFRGNKLLCTQVIQAFQSHVNQHIRYDSEEFKDACNKEFYLSVAFSGSLSITLNINDSLPTTEYDDRTLSYYYIVYYRPVRNASKSITADDEGWMRKRSYQPWLIEIENLESFVTYAVFAERFSINHGYARSNIVHQRTKPAAPGMPCIVENAESISSTWSTISLRWLAPINPKGIIKRYHIQYVEQSLTERRPNYCATDFNISTSMTAVVPVAQQKCSINRSNISSWLETGRMLFNDSMFHPLIDRLISTVRKEEAVYSRLVEELTELQINLNMKQEDYIDLLLAKAYFEHSPTNSINNDLVAVIEKLDQIKNKSITSSKSGNSTMNGETAKLLLSNMKARQGSKKPAPAASNHSTVATNPVGDYSFRKFKKDNFTITVEQPERLRVTLKNLKRFTNYEVYLYACQDVETGNILSELCSPPARVGITTDGVPMYDEVNTSTITVGCSRPDHCTISWNRPAKPNGDMVVKYLLKLSKGDAVVARYCVNGDKFNSPLFTVQNEVTLEPGEYGVSIQSISLYGPSNWTVEKSITIPLWEDTSSLYVALSSMGVFTLVLLLCAVLVFIRFHRRYIREKTARTSFNPDYMVVSYKADEWELERQRITIIRELGQGSFGMVYEGLYANGTGNSVRVAVKTSSANSLRERIDFLKEASLMKEFTECNHVVRLIGVVSRSQPVLVVMELMENGDLKGFLRRHRVDAANPIGRPPPSHQQRIQIAAQIADGMAYLSAHKFVHRDLAARNCMVHSDFTVKIGDFGLARDVYETDYYRPEQARPLPIRWMAPEAIRDGLFNTKTDIWSFGVVLWEIATLAAQPYAGLTNEQVAQTVIEGVVLERPSGCSNVLYSIMLSCWRYSPRSRPDFSDILGSLEHDVSYRFHSTSWYFMNRDSMPHATRSRTEMTLASVTGGIHGISTSPSRLRDADASSYTQMRQSERASINGVEDVQFQSSAHLKSTPTSVVDIRLSNEL